MDRTVLEFLVQLFYNQRVRFYQLDSHLSLLPLKIK